jgi:HlyD family secretion protein
MKRVLWLTLVALAIGAGAWGYFSAQSRGSSPQYRVARVERGALTAIISASGNLNAVTTVQVGSQISGRIKELFADFNSVVRKGQMIARLDPEILEAKVNQARAEIDSALATVLTQQAQVERARADVDNARAALAEAVTQTARAEVALLDAARDLERKRELIRRGLIAKSDRDAAQTLYDSAVTLQRGTRAREQALTAAIRSAEAQLRVAEATLVAIQAQVKQKEAALEQTLVDLGYTTIRAPVDGVVISRSVDIGQTVAASLQAPILFTIARDLTQMQIEAHVVEADIARIKVDHRVTFTVDALPNETFSGRVAQIRKAGQTVQNVVTYTVVVAVSNLGGKLLPGMTANVKFIVTEKRGVLTVPNVALRFRPSTDGVDSSPTPAGETTAGAGGSGDIPSTRESTLERLVQSLKLTEEQRRRIAPIVAEASQQRRALREAGLPEPERKARSTQVKAEMKAKIRDVLTPDQQARYERLADADREGGRGTVGRVWVLDPDGTPRPIVLTLGIGDGKNTEVLGGDLKEGQEVLVGLSGPPEPPDRKAGRPRLRL